MPSNTFVTIEDLIICLESWGVNINLSADQQRQIERRYAPILAAACKQWEHATGFFPFVCDSDGSGNPVATTRTFDGQGRNDIQFAGGLCSLNADGTPTVPDSGTSGVILRLNGSIYANTFYALKPNNASFMGKPYRSVKFGRLQDGWLPIANGPTEDGVSYLGQAQRVISLTGYWGYCVAQRVAVDAPDAKEAVLARACQDASLAGELAQIAARGGVIKSVEGDESYTYSIDAFVSLLKSKTVMFALAAQDYASRLMA